MNSKAKCGGKCVMNVFNAGQFCRFANSVTMNLFDIFPVSKYDSGLLSTKNLSNLNECKDACKKTKGCKGFNWIKPQCQLFEGRLVMDDSDIPGVVAGILPCP